MASLKAPSTALQQFFRHSIYDLYDFEPEKPLRLVYGTFNLAILLLLNEYLFFKTKNNHKLNRLL